MAEKRTPVVFAYVVVASTRKHDPAVDVSHAPAAPAIGDIIVFPDHQGDVVIREDDHEVLVDIVHLHLLCRGTKLENGDVDFEYEGRRLLALVQIGSNAERVLHTEIDRVFERFEEALHQSGADPIGSDGLERLRREFA